MRPRFLTDEARVANITEEGKLMKRGLVSIFSRRRGNNKSRNEMKCLPSLMAKMPADDA